MPTQEIEKKIENEITEKKADTESTFRHFTHGFRGFFSDLKIHPTFPKSNENEAEKQNSKQQKEEENPNPFKGYPFLHR